MSIAMPCQTISRFGYRCHAPVAILPNADPGILSKRRTPREQRRRRWRARRCVVQTQREANAVSPQERSPEAQTERDSTTVETSDHEGAVDVVSQGGSAELEGILSDGAFLAQFCRSQDASEALLLLSTTLSERTSAERDFELMPDHVNQLVSSCLERNAVELCLSIYRQMTSLPRLSGSQDEALSWPSPNLDIVCTLVLSLAKRMRVNDALAILTSLGTTGATSDAQQIVFGKVINSPLPPNTPLTLVQPQEGFKTVACSASRYLFEVFSGDVSSVNSDTLEAANDLWVTVARFLKLWQKPAIRAIHDMVVTTPSGIPRSFRFGTESADVPAKVSDRVSIVCTPATTEEKNFGILAPIPPSTRPGEALRLTNHSTSVSVPLITAPDKNTVDTVPGWILPAAVILAGEGAPDWQWAVETGCVGTDAASSMIDPNLPLIGAASVAAIGASVTISNSALLPRLRQLPENRLGAEPLRQELLGRHQTLISKIEEMTKQASQDVVSLAKLWQLESKMTSVDASGKYEARIQRIHKARSSLENRLIGRMELMFGYRRVANMIEIEVEMDVEVPAAEMEGIEEQLMKLEEVESLKEEMEFQAEAQDEVERLLRSTDNTVMP